jgi:hypothetical protein
MCGHGGKRKDETKTKKVCVDLIQKLIGTAASDVRSAGCCRLSAWFPGCLRLEHSHSLRGLTPYAFFSPLVLLLLRIDLNLQVKVAMPTEEILYCNPWPLSAQPES